ncbi:MAG: phosphoglucosamine mutase [Nitrospirae bacterium CG18_big_fil_WC_8_21_14_2_50_70_55]|nr:phosphoglucosamine mutase [Deltaproteobacteria bacterium]OIP66161.1 MAG: phosphoglucosamine mutase [Nitrospirae bacterium CG2_30_70_394]PIQ06847.1 MAG: phosphoglucosamine mutase [Nitrospirae bacterium CG18_big_fil_WC_8_21_14_2_50_70_55]PIU79672.1 MAG: phosphoglucosamine mutase [Nitrospirae bacterium CG06_land_8_20_14_3_00_70_43]PIW83731.1 MAG: phosphoglucosamine mutase [Nitrospirae bacterium CG_4_8_14_3_um_filter_70_85]PIX83658.1 MAG: phosphoglucosamine mutase [Nitrospirae bacterium CG_4_10
MERKIFGTDGVRGVANVYPIDGETAMRLGRAAAHVFKQGGDRRHRIVIGKDTRLSGYLLEFALASGICSMGVDVTFVGPLPTPGIAFITKGQRADAGIVISASHNPYMDNGIKFFGPDGYKLPDALEREIEELVLTGKIDDVRPTAEEVGSAFRQEDAVGRYVSYLKTAFSGDRDLEGVRMVIDCGHGATYRVAPLVFSELGAETIVINNTPDGTNINDGCGSTHPEGMREAVKAYRADFGVAFDGDGDRVIMADERGALVDGDHCLAIAALAMQRDQTLRDKTVVATVMSNLGLEVCLKEHGIRLLRTQVGDRYVVEEMVKGNLNLGGEQSGHVIFRDWNTTGDGVLTGLRIIDICRRQGRPLSELAAVMTDYPQVIRNVVVKSKPPIAGLDGVGAAIRDAEATLGERGRVLVRYSGTEPKVRVMVEGESEVTVIRLAEQIAGHLAEAIG